MEYNFQVENIRCGGCANTITTKLTEMNQVKEVHVNIDERTVIIKTNPDSGDDMRQTLGKKLAKLGYPEIGTVDSNSLMTKATSVVSCAIGKVSKKS